MKDGYVDAEKHEFSIDLFPFEMTNLRIPVYVKPLEYTIEEFKEKGDKLFDDWDNKVKEKYFTKERIDELKELFIKRIRETENPFHIAEVDGDRFDVPEELIFNLK